MIRVKIGEYEKDINNANERWINQMINGYKKDKIPFSVNVIIEERNLNIVLSTPTNSSSGRAPRANEKTVCELWAQLGLNKSDFTGGNLIAFLKQLKRIM